MSIVVTQSSERFYAVKSILKKEIEQLQAVNTARTQRVSAKRKAIVMRGVHTLIEELDLQNEIYGATYTTL